MTLTLHGLLFDVDAETTPEGEHLLHPTSHPDWSIKVTSRPLNTESFDKAVHIERARAAAQVKNAKVLERTHLTLAGVPTWVFVQGGQSADGFAVQQMLALMHANEHLVAMHLMGADEASDSMRACFESALIGLRPVVANG